MLAIPSPDVLLNLFASGAQVLGLLVLAVGGGWMSRRRFKLGGVAPTTGSPWPFRVTLALLVAVSASFVLYHLRTVDAKHQRLRANLVRSSTEGGKKVGDTSLKTLSYSDQVSHRCGVTTDQLAGWIQAGESLNLVDVREPEEVEMGAIAGSWARRYPDLQADPSGLAVEGRRTVLICESGNRSSELSDYFAEQGLETSFVIGGYEKWVAEGRPMQGARSHSGDSSDIRATPDYPHKSVLLDTAEAVRLFTREHALFVDVRYPEEFAQGHLPGAVNVPLRRLTSDAAAAALRALPARPLIAVCYDKRSSFYGLLLGLRLWRLGADFRGRYTVPHEFTLPRAESEWVARWRNDREGRSLLGAPRAALASGLGWLADRWGLWLAIVALVLALRAAMLPLALLAERDQWRQRRLLPGLEALKQQHAADPVALRRTHLRLLRAAGVSPLRNLAGSLLQLFLFAFAFAAVDALAGRSTVSWLWLQPGEPDPYAVLPLLFGVVLALFVRLQQQRRDRWLLPALFVVAMVALVWQCRAAVQFYLVLGIGSMAVQSLLQRAWLRRRDGGSADVAVPAPARLIDLRDAGRHPALGNKAVRLGQLLRAGLPVPAGFVVPHGLAPEPRELARACRRAGILAAAVRSSAEGEDGLAQSMAGMFRTELDVVPSGLLGAIAEVRASYGGRPGGVVVQAFQRAEYAGVMFTVDPAHTGRMVIELVPGGGDALVSGRATPQTFRFGRVTGERLAGDEAPPIDLAALIELGRRVERLFGRPQDIEWVYCNGRFQLVQARDITRTAADRQGDDGVREQERARLLAMLHDAPADAEVLAQTEIAELLPAPTTYSLSLFESLWAASGTVDFACRALGFPYDVAPGDRPYVVTAFGRCYVDRREAARRTHKQLGAVASFRLTAAAQALAEELQASLPALRRNVTRLEAMHLERLPLDELLALCDETRRRFQEQTYVRAEMINMAAEFFVGAARRQAQKRGVDAASLLADGGNVVSEAFAVLSGAGTIERRVDDFLQRFGHRAVHDFELAEPRYGETRERVAAIARTSGRQERPAPPSVVPTGVLGVAVERARQCQQLKELAKHEAMRELAVLRRLLLAVGDRCGLGEAIFDLTAAEVSQLAEPAFRAQAGALAGRRRQRREVLLSVAAPTVLTPAVIERLGEEELTESTSAAGLVGTCVAGSREVVGRVRVLHDAASLDQLRPGEILVTRCTDPCWMPAFGIAGGLVTEIGGWLSHAAIQAREHDLTTVVGAAGCTARLQDGDLVRLCRDGSVAVLEEQRTMDRHRVDIEGTLHWGVAVMPVRVRNLSCTGAGVEVSTRVLPSISEAPEFELRLAEVKVRATLAWANCERVGLVFTSPLPVELAQSPLARTG